MDMPMGHARACASDLILVHDALDGAAKSLAEVPGTEPVGHLQYLGKLYGEAISKASAGANEVRARLLAAAP